MTPFAKWLAEIGLGSYAVVFASNKIDFDVIRSLSDADLRELGLALGDRKRLLQAVAKLGGQTAPDSSIPQTAAAPPRETAVSHPGERRQLTVMFCDLVGSTALSEKLDPEELRSLLHAYRNLCGDVIARYDGFVARYLGDGILTYFGWPTAHEEDAERAVRAALEIVQTVKSASSTEDLSVHIGIATGPVVVGEATGAGDNAKLAVGSTPNLAARLQALAAADQIVIAASTRRLVGSTFALTDLGGHSLKGIAEPQHVWIVLGESGQVSRFEALRSRETPLVGRQEEVALLLRRWEQAKRGEGRVALISGESGIGKSRLTAALSEHVETVAHARLRYFCSPYHQDSAFYPVIGQLERAAGFAREDEPETKRDKVAAMFAPAAEAGDVSLLLELLSLPGGDRFPPLALSPQSKKQRTFTALLRQLEELARTQPTLLIFEDLHWIDATSREFLDLLLARLDRLPVLLVATFRSEFQPPWTGQPHVTLIPLNRLGRGDGATMVERLIGSGALLAPDVIAEIVERTDGVPLFIEEMTKAVLEAGAARGQALAASVPSAGLGVPATLQASLMARLDRLGAAAKGVAQIGAAIGREFSYELAASAGHVADDLFQDALQCLVEAGLVFQRGTPPAAEYLFKHALVQDAAYSSLLRRTRQQLHARIAAALEAKFPDRAVREPEVLGRHFSEAQQPDRAVGYWLAAGERAIQRSANQEAISHLTAGLAQLAQLPDTADRTKQELALQMALGPALFGTKPHSHPDIGRAYARAQELCKQLGDDMRRFTALRGLQLHHLSLQETEKSQHLAEEALRVAERLDDSSRLVGAHQAVGAVFYHQGKLVLAGPHLRLSLEKFDPGAHKFLDWPGSHPAIQSEFYLALISWMLGYPDQALEETGAAVKSAEALGHPLSFAQTLCYGALVHVFRHEPSACRDYAVRAISTCEERRIVHMHAFAVCAHGWALSVSGESEKGLAQIAEGLANYGVGPSQYILLVLQADAQIATALPDEALLTIAEALNAVERTVGAPLEAELHRLKGEALLAGTGKVSEAEAAIQRGIDVARRQNAKSWELRGATSLARLWIQQGRHEQARALLVPVYGWFQEGFDTADLKKAKTLLNELK
jgi:class 3 adenylate cyclase/tetratricopeptide (TPR) repeat protein